MSLVHTVLRRQFSVLGFTLIELSVVISITVLLMLIGIPSFRSYRENATLRGEAETLLGDLRLAQQLTLASQGTHLVKLNTTAPLGFVVIRRETDDTVIKQHSLHPAVSWQDSGEFTNYEVVFTTTGAVVEAGNIVLQGPGGRTSTVELKPSGYARLQ